MTPVLLAVVALLDGCFSGFRAAAGRDGRIDKRAYARRACRDGTLAGAAVLGLLAAACGVAMATGTSYDAFTRSGRAMLWVLLPYAITVLLALAGWALLRPLWMQTLTSTLVLGPFTLVRPLVVAGGVLAACLATESWAVRATGVLAGVLVLSVEPLLLRRPPPDVPMAAQPRTLRR